MTPETTSDGWLGYSALPPDVELAESGSNPIGELVVIIIENTIYFMYLNNVTITLQYKLFGLKNSTMKCFSLFRTFKQNQQILLNVVHKHYECLL